MDIFAAALAAVFACQPKENIEFALDNDSLVVGADGDQIAKISIVTHGPPVAAGNVYLSFSPVQERNSDYCVG